MFYTSSIRPEYTFVFDQLYDQTADPSVRAIRMDKFKKQFS